MSSMFWGLRLEPAKRYSTTVDKSFHVSMAALDCSSIKSDNEVLSVMLEEDEANVPYILCNLNKQKAMQSKLDLNFMTGDRVTFFCKGNGVVHLSGYIVPDDDDFSDHVGDEDMDEECEEEENNEMETSKGSPSKGKGKINGLSRVEKRKSEDASPGVQKKTKAEDAESEESDDEEEDDIEGLEEMGDESEGIEEEDEGEESDEDDEESEEGEEEIQTSTPQQQHQKKDKKKIGGIQLSNISKQQTPNLNKQQTPGKSPKTPNGMLQNQQSGKKEKKKSEVGSNTPKMNKSVTEGGTPQKKTLEGGVVVKDIKIGNGPVCKAGRLATVYYTGRLKSNNKVFDSTSQGPGFKFRVGRGEVIKGWDVGVAGMKVGGKRIVICPPHMAYGQKGSPPTIPGNSALVFEVELKGVN